MDNNKNMYHLVESHMGGFYITNLDKEVIQKPCEQCGDCDWVKVSFTKEEKIPKIIEFLSNPLFTNDQVIEDINNNILIEEYMDHIEYEITNYRYLVEDLLENNYITLEESRLLYNAIRTNSKKNIGFVKALYQLNNKLVLTNKEQ